MLRLCMDLLLCVPTFVPIVLWLCPDSRDPRWQVASRGNLRTCETCPRPSLEHPVHLQERVDAIAVAQQLWQRNKKYGGNNVVGSAVPALLNPQRSLASKLERGCLRRCGRSGVAARLPGNGRPVARIVTLLQTSQGLRLAVG